MTPETLVRTAQLLHKTNQFNLTTHRYKQTEVATFAAASGCDVYTVNVRDRFGDNGLVGVVMTQRDGDVCLIDAFLLSCRVIGRTVDTAVLALLAQKNRARGVARLEGWFLPTRKNAPAAGFYRNHGFTLVQQKGDGATLWSLDLTETVPQCPSWIEMNMAKESAA
jgi:FkbH-like protein